jgi:peroxiredoxin
MGIAGHSAGRRRDARFGSATRLVSLAVVAAVLSAGCGRDDGAAADGLPVGTEVGHRAPPLTGVRGDGRSFELSPRGEGTAVVFFRGYHCGLCRERLRELQANLGEYERAGVTVIAATAEASEGVQRAVQELGLGFAVVSVDSATLGSWGVVEGSHNVPLPGSYLLDNRGVVIFRHVGRNAADRARDIEVLAALQNARSR